MLNDPLFPSSYAYYDHHDDDDDHDPMSLDDLYYYGNRLTYPFSHNFSTQTRLVPLERMGRQQIAQAHAQRAFEEQERRRQQYQMEQELLRIKMARQRRVAMEQRREEEKHRRRCQEQYHKMLLEEKKRQILKKERERLMAEKEADELAEHICLNNSITRKGHECEDNESSKRYQIIQGPGGALYQVPSCLPDTKEEYYSADSFNDDEDWNGFVRKNLRRNNKPKVRFVQKASAAAPPRKETSIRRMPNFHALFDKQEETLQNEQQQSSRRKMNTIPILKVPTKMTSSARTMLNKPTVESKVQVESTGHHTDRVVKTAKHLNEEKIVKSSSEVVFGEVEDASDDEMEDSNSIWTNRRPSEGQWMEPIVGFEY